MSLADAQPPASGEAGWYPDPLGGESERYYDGSRWTDRIRRSEAGPGSASGTPRPSDGGSWWSLRPRWAQWTMGIVAALIILIIGVAIGGAGSNEGELKDEVASLEKSVSQAEGSAEKAKAAAERAEAVEAEAIKAGEEKAEQIVGRAEAKAKKVVGHAGIESEHLGERISEQEAELTSLEEGVSSKEAKIASLRGEEGEAEEIAAKSEITDGTWQAERDYIPGTYEAPGGGGCYWALLSEPGGGGIEGIIENGGFNKHQILNITSPYFETSGCGTWKRVGE
ncbi:MAG: DUF2510 domain-containing protein [Actinobacteria bacterium]|nr:DUF2510 domain-containing protein [Actinomycetota bacterium]